MMKHRVIGIVCRIVIVALLWVTPVWVRPAAGAETDPNADLFDMSINQLMDVQIDAPASITSSTTRHRKSRSLRVASSAENWTSSV